MLRIFRHYVPASMLLLGAAETLVLLVSVYIAVTVQLAGAAAGVGVPGPVWPAAIGFAVVMLATMLALGLYQRELRDSPVMVLAKLVLAFGVGLVALVALCHLEPRCAIGGTTFGLAVVAGFLGIASCRLIYLQRTEGAMARRALVLGTGEKAQRIAGLRRRADHLGTEIVGFVAGGSGPRLVPEARIVGAADSLPDVVERLGVDELVVAVDDRRGSLPVDALLACKLRGVTITEDTTYFERQLGRISLDSLHPSNVFYADGFTQAVLRTGVKRALDLAASLAMLLLAAPVMAAAAIAIAVESRGRGGVLFRQTRIGRDEVPFEVLKFRSMRPDAEADGQARWASEDDPRITRVGRWLRKTRIDELPQLINVLRGEMSLVGPRPERPEFVDQLARQIPYYRLRHAVKPGITGWAQICHRYGASVADARIKLEYDLYYIKNYSLFLDLTVLAQTVQVVLWGKGSR